MRRLVRNMIRCKRCGSVVESVSRHDYETCECGRCSVDGGHDYHRVGALDLNDIEDLSVWEDVEITKGADDEDE